MIRLPCFPAGVYLNPTNMTNAELTPEYRLPLFRGK